MKTKEELEQCFANRGLLCTIDTLDPVTLGIVQEHLDKCEDCQAWAKKHNLVWRIKVKFSVGMK